MLYPILTAICAVLGVTMIVRGDAGFAALFVAGSIVAGISWLERIRVARAKSKKIE